MGKRKKVKAKGHDGLAARIAAELAAEERPRTCYDCMFCREDGSLWMRTLVSGFPVLGMCANHPETPGQWQPVPSEPCRNFRPKPGLGRVEPPEPPDDTIRYIPLTRGLHAIVDVKNYEWLNQYKWYAQARRDGATFYACRNSRRRTIMMHREIMKPPPGKVVDHINGNGIDNREANMRNCTQAQNTLNKRAAKGCKSGFAGVNPAGDKWQADFKHKGQRQYLGLFDDKIEAAKARGRKAYELAGEFAYLNFPDEIKRT
ncbi:MAG: HNH endonuclease [Sedimentisphaerales bacterium]|nr:HNH endonuclease [Sedimentisphaerales bacterium]